MIRWKPNIVQIAGTVFLLGLLWFLSRDLISALAAEPCPGALDCYPWGAEGPGAGRWSYASRQNYLIRGFSQLVLLTGTGVYLIRHAGTKRPLSRNARRALLAAMVAVLYLNFI